MYTKCYAYILILLFSAQGIAAECIPTPQRTTGNHYKPVTMEKTDISTGLIVRGQILAAPDCSPVANARVAHWQAGEHGRYEDRLRAYLYTDANGRYLFETEWPNLFTPHIHFIVTAEGYKQLETQWIGDQRQSTVVFDMVLTKE